MDKVNFLLIKFFNTWIGYLEQFWYLVGFIFGVCLILAWLARKSFLSRIFISVAIIAACFQLGLYFFLPSISVRLANAEVHLGDYHLWGFMLGAPLGFSSVILAIRYTSPAFEKIISRLTKKSKVERNQKTDIRQIGIHLPDGQKQYDPRKYFDLRKGVFFGLDEKSRPVFVPAEKWKKSHVDIVGTTGSGKGVAAGVLLTQAILSGECVVVVDPKNDEFLSHVLCDAAMSAGVKYVYIDLLSDCPQWNPLQNKTAYEIDELFAAGFSLGEKGTDADFYRLDDRRASRIASNIPNASSMTVTQMLTEMLETQPNICESGKKFISDLEEISLIKSTDICVGADLGELINEGAVIYVRGSMRNPKILKLQRMFVLSIMQHIESRGRQNAKHVCIFLDEFKSVISRPAVEALGAIRDKRAHVMIAHQSLGDLKDCPSDLNPDSVVSSVNENCSIKISYAVKDPDTADWLARMSGMILVDDEIREVKTNAGLTEISQNARTLRQADRNLIDTNMLTSLPDRCAVIYGVGLAKFFFTAPITVKKSKFAVTPTQYGFASARLMNDKEIPSIRSAQTVAQSLLDV